MLVLCFQFAVRVTLVTQLLIHLIRKIDNAGNVTGNKGGLAGGGGVKGVSEWLKGNGEEEIRCG